MITPGSNTFRSEAPSHAEVVDSLPHIVWTAQPDGQVDWLSREFEQYTGISGARNVQSGWMQAIHVEDRDKLKESWTESTESAHSYKTEVRVWSDRSKDWRVNMVSARAQVSPEGEVIRWFGTVTDIQSLYDAEAERAYELKIRKLESEVLRAIGTGGTLHQIFTLICCKVEELLPDARTVITRITPDGCLGDGFSIRMPVAFMDSCKGIPIGPKSGTCGTAAFRRDLVVIEDTLTDPLWEDCRDLAITFGLRSSIACPVLDEAGNSVATLALHFPDPFRPTSTESLTAQRLAEFVFLALSATRDRELLLQSEARYRSLFNLMPVSVWEEDISAVLEELEALRQTGVSDFRAWLKGNAEFIARMIGKIRIIGVNQTTLALHGVDIQIICADGLWTVEIDPGQFESAILNLVINARDAMPDGGDLTIEVNNTVLDDDYVATEPELQAGDYVMVGITDNGHGIPRDLLNRVFEPFFTPKEVGKGSGLGLSMVFGFLKQSSGHIRIYSEPGEGTTVKLYFRRAASAYLNRIASPSQSRILGGEEVILVVEDDELVCEHVMALVGSLGYRAIKATNARDALAILSDTPEIDLLFTDVVMPGGMGGRELAEAARRMRPGLKVLFTSGYTENSIVHNGRLDRGVELISKPYGREQLSLKLR